MALRLQQAGQSFMLVGSSQLPSAANVAAGIINPVTGRWMTKSWRFDDFAPEAADFYTEIGRLFSADLYHPLSALRFCLNTDDAKRAQRRSRNPRYANVLDEYDEASGEEAAFKNIYGSFRIRGAAYVDLPRFTELARKHFHSNRQYKDEVFKHKHLKKADTGWSYAGRSYDRVIFCEGAALNENPWFRGLPLAPAKGETLLCRSEGLELKGHLHHHGKWLLPYPDGSFRLGATYDENDLSQNPTEAARKELIEAFQDMINDSFPLEVLDQKAGLRPSTHDARPFLGVHRDEPGLYILNGLGSKGASLVPTLSRELLDFILEGTPLDPETDIHRFS